MGTLMESMILEIPITMISLPVSLIDFKATKENDVVRLSWSTQSEVNNEYFTVERSSDGVFFKEILTQPGAGNSNIQNSYQDFDQQPNQGYNYYRLEPDRL